MTTADRTVLMENAAFRRFLFDVVQRAGVFETIGNALDGRQLILEGRRSLALEMLRDLDQVQPIRSASGIPVLTLIQALHEEVQSTGKEKPDGATRGTYAEIEDDG